jgi:hypothetical protein
MRSVALIIQNLMRLLAVVLLVLGFMFWSRHGFSLLLLHARLGVVAVALLWALCLIGFRTGVKAGLVLTGLLWGFVLLWFGFQMYNGGFRSLFPGGSYEVARVLHFFISVGAVGLAEVIGKRIRLIKSRS